MSRPVFSNRILRALTSADYALLESGLEYVELKLREALETANTPISHAYFPESGIVSIVARSQQDHIEAGVIGREGMTGAAVVMGNHRSPNDAIVQVAGWAYRVSADQLRTAINASASLRQIMQNFTHVFMVQVSQTALANGRSKITERLARWLLMVHDRSDEDEIHLTHEFIAVMLGVRRPGVTDALHELEGGGLIRTTRATIQIVDRTGLLRVAGTACGVPEAEYERLLGLP